VLRLDEEADRQNCANLPNAKDLRMWTGLCSFLNVKDQRDLKEANMRQDLCSFSTLKKGSEEVDGPVQFLDARKGSEEVDRPAQFLDPSKERSASRHRFPSNARILVP
jgi:hypothetical protein